MRLAIYGGSFNPPHLGHLEVARSVCAELAPDRLLIIPDNIPPHKELYPGSPSPEERMELCALNFASVAQAELSDMEILREGKSYTAHTVEELIALYPGDELVLVVGSDMFLSFEQWYRFEWLLEKCHLAVLSREEDDRLELLEHKDKLEGEYGAKITVLSHEAMPMCSEDIRTLLRRRMGREYLSDEVYESIIRHGYYEAQPDLTWLREKVLPYLSSHRLAHVAGCESEAVLLALHWGEDAENAATAAILHDITKALSYEEQLILCEKYGIILGNDELGNEKILHPITGAALARDLFGISDEIYEAIRWHTTGKGDMSLLEKIIYLADYIEPTRDFPGLDKLRELCYENIDAAMALGLEMSLEEIRQRNVEPHPASVEALIWYK